MTEVMRVLPAEPGTFHWGIHGKEDAPYAHRRPIIGWYVYIRDVVEVGNDDETTIATEPIPLGGNTHALDMFDWFIEMPDGMCYVPHGEQFHSLHQALTHFKCPWPEHFNPGHT